MFVNSLVYTFRYVNIDIQILMIMILCISFI